VDVQQRARRDAEHQAARQAEAVARQVEAQIAKTPDLGEVNPNLILRLMQALMRLFRQLFDRIARTEKTSEDTEANGSFGYKARPLGVDSTGEVRGSSNANLAEQGTVPRSSVDTARIRPGHAGTAAPMHDSASEIEQGIKLAPAVDGEPAQEPKTVIGSIGNMTIDLATDPVLRHRLEAVGPNEHLQTALYMAAVVNALAEQAREHTIPLESYGAALNLRLAPYQAQCARYGGQVATARLLQIGVISPSDICAGFASEVAPIEGRYQNQLDQLDDLRVAMIEAARQAYLNAADSPLQNQILSEMELPLKGLLGGGWRNTLALERMASRADDAGDGQSEVEQEVQTNEDVPSIEPALESDSAPTEALAETRLEGSDEATLQAAQEGRTEGFFSESEPVQNDGALGELGEGTMRGAGTLPPPGSTPAQPMSRDEAMAVCALIAEDEEVELVDIDTSSSEVTRERG
jgi:hypothetical protein